ncbi:uncharacterized protein [Clytia hemisphaerica]|uniref:Transcription initiation factor TFIID subunit 12 n=1 Tax=Clytia hemisphaerica TaxID=252671 RepID=A0A7M5U3S4_9CNID
MAAPNPSSTNSTTQPISMMGTAAMGIVQNPQNMTILQNHAQQQLFQSSARPSPQQLVTGVRPIVNVGNQQAVTTLQNIQVLGAANHPDGMGSIPINIITTGGQTFAVASNISGGLPNQVSQIRPIAPNAATVVSQLGGAPQIRAAFDGRKISQVKGVPNVGAITAAATVVGQPAKSTQGNLTLPIQSITATTSNTPSSNTSTPQQSSSATAQPQHSSQALTKRKLQDLLHEIDPTETMDDDVEEALLHIADDFIENVITASCQLAKHRRSNILDVKDVQLHLDRNWNMWIPGFGSEDLRPYKKAPATEAHKQRLALIKKAMKK